MSGANNALGTFLEAHTDFRGLQNEGFTIREIELISGVSKSQVARELKENN